LSREVNFRLHPKN